MKANSKIHNLWTLPGTLVVPLAASVVVAAILGGCQNRRDSQDSQDASTALLAPNILARATQYKLAFINVTPLTSSSGSSSSGQNLFVAQINLDTKTSPGPITTVCQPASSSNPAQNCSCDFTWSDFDSSNSGSGSVPREVKTSVEKVDSFSLQCKLPAAYDTEIQDDTQVTLRIIPTGASTFETNKLKFTKQTKFFTGAFQDTDGNDFETIFRYSCFQEFRKGLALKNRKLFYKDGEDNKDSGSSASSSSGPSSGASRGTVAIATANQFCFRTSDGKTLGKGCDIEPNEIPALGSSAQSYYLSLYSRGRDLGQINISNESFTCPQVPSDEALNPQRFWPMDSTFALATGPSEQFRVGVEAFTKLSVSHTVEASTTCGVTSSPSNGTAGSSSPVLSGCLGWAAKPKANGFCPNIVDSKGKVRPTYRLRRYRVLYPPQFEPNGWLVAGDGGKFLSDTIYVADRPVAKTYPTHPTADYEGWVSELGPKPCPSAFFDHSNTTGKFDKNGGYVATNDPAWSGKNADGIEFPWEDFISCGQDENGKTDCVNRHDARNDSCSAVLPLLNDSGSVWTMGTVSPNNPYSKLKRVAVRPIEPWVPFYDEDKDFQACAPLPAHVIDPPLHFAKIPQDQGNVAWCAEVYPNRNSDIKTDLATNSTALPSIHSSTAHKVTNVKDATACSNECKASSTEACDKDACYHSTSIANARWTKYPLLAPADMVELALKTSPQYQCTITQDKTKAKLGRSPAGGCCSLVGVKGDGPLDINAPSAHLEPHGIATTCSDEGGQPDY